MTSERSFTAPHPLAVGELNEALKDIIDARARRSYTIPTGKSRTLASDGVPKVAGNN